MATINQASNKFLFFNSSSSSSSSSPSSFSRSCISTVKATINEPKIRIITMNPIFLPKHSTNSKTGNKTAKADTKTTPEDTKSDDPAVIAKLYAIMEAVADRIEMHKNIGNQRDNWNHLLLTSINTITLTAATMCGISATAVGGGGAAAFKVSSTVLYLAAAGMLALMNSIQPSQLAEEQRNASRLFKQLYLQIQTLISIGNPKISDVNEAIEKVLALDRAFPLPLLGAMLERFPSTVQPAVWWPEKTKKKKLKRKSMDGNVNGWSGKNEDEMREIVRVLKRKDKADYLRLGEIALKLHKILAISGPVLTAIAAIGAAFVRGKNHPWAVVIGVGGGALASIVNAVEHGGQVGMVFQMYRSNAGFFKLMEERIESNVDEEDVKRRENGEIFQLKIGLELGRNLLELKNLAAASSSSLRNDEFASKLF